MFAINPNNQRKTFLDSLGNNEMCADWPGRSEIRKGTLVLRKRAKKTLENYMIRMF